MSAVIVIVVVLILVWYVYKRVSKTKKIEELKNAYEEALRGTDKAKAVALGRAYYGALRSTSSTSINGVPTVYDEAAITNDIATMKVQ